MEALFEKIVFPKTQAFSIRDLNYSSFWYPWHFHPELELTCILKSTGHRFVGDSVEPFEEGDLVLVGPNLPHFWRNDEPYYENEQEGAARCIVLQFREDFLGNEFLKVRELQKLNRLFSLSARGLHFTGNTAKNVRARLIGLLDLEGMGRIIELLSILRLLIESDEVSILSRSGYAPNAGSADMKRINKVYQYAIANFRSGANLQDAAKIACLNPSSFCRFFKLRTHKTFIQFLNDLKLNHASKLLKESDVPIATVAYDSGFQNLSNFNRQFKKAYGKTPRQIRAYFRL